MQKPLVVVQDVFLNRMRKDNILINLSLLNGSELQGIVKGFDAFVILLEHCGGKQTMIYKHALASITPEKAQSKE